MESITQSYNMYDSTSFKLVKNVKQLITRKPDHKLGEPEDFIQSTSAAKKYLAEEQEE